MKELHMDTPTAMELLGCTRRWLQMMRQAGKIRIVTPGVGRGRHAVYAIPVEMIKKAAK
jgi:hypothetical protein